MLRTGTIWFVIAACLVVGCKRSSSVVGPDGSRTTVTESGGTTDVVIEGKDGAKMQISQGGSVALPDGFPKDLPVYPGAKVTVSLTTGDGVNVMLQTSDAVAKVAAFYKDKLKENGWAVESEMNMGEGSMFSAKKDKRTAAVVINAESSGSMISLTVGEEK